jgi:hypothetical protein
MGCDVISLGDLMSFKILWKGLALILLRLTGKTNTLRARTDH